MPTDGESNKRAGAVGAALQAYPFLPVQFEDGSYPYQVRDLTTVFGATALTSGIASELPNPVSMATQVNGRAGRHQAAGERLRGVRAVGRFAGEGIGGR